MKIYVAQLNPVIGDLEGNTQKILEVFAKQRGRCDLILFSELALTGYPPQDLLLLPSFIEAVESHLQQIVSHSHGLSAIIGVPRRTPADAEKGLYNSAAILIDGELVGFQDKCLLPTYDVFDERRYFEPATTQRVWEIAGKKVAITICEDIWQHADLVVETSYHVDPIAALKKENPEVVVNLSASPYAPGKLKKRILAATKAATTLKAPVILCNQVGGNDSLIFDGYSFHVDAHGKLLQLAKGFEEDGFNTGEATIGMEMTEDLLADLYQALVLGIRDYFHKSGFRRACLGLSGGIDSALTLCLAVAALGKENILALSMPSRFSSEGSVDDAHALAQILGVEEVTLPIEKPFQAYLDLLHPYFQGPFDVTEENLQARIRGMLLMAFSNKHGYIVLSTGNKSEFAMGYSTLYGDMCGGLGVIGDLTKTQVYALARWINRDQEIIPTSTITKPPSAELRANQKDSDSLPDYDVVDAVLQAYIVDHKRAEEIAHEHHLDLKLVQGLIVRIHRHEYKRRQGPPVLRVSDKAFTVGRHFPIVQKWE